MKTIRLSGDDYRIKNGKLEAFFCLKAETYNDDYEPNYDSEFGYIESKYQVGTEVILYSHTNVSPNAIRNGTDIPHYKIMLDNGEGIGGNLNRNIKRYHGWRGTSCDISTHVYGLRKIVKMRTLKNGFVSITLSDDLNPNEE